MASLLWSVAGNKWEDAPPGAEPDVEIACAHGEVRRYHACVLSMASPVYFQAAIRFKRQQQQDPDWRVLLHFDHRDLSASLVDHVVRTAYRGTPGHPVDLLCVLDIVRAHEFFGIKVIPPHINIQDVSWCVATNPPIYVWMKRKEDDVFVADDASLEKLNRAIGSDVMRSVEVARADTQRNSWLDDSVRAFARIRINGIDYDTGGTDDGLCRAFLRAICDAVDESE